MGDGYYREHDSGFGYEIAGYRLNGEWIDVEAGGHAPRDDDWSGIDLVTINFEPHTDEGYYRQVHLGWDRLDPPSDPYGFDIDDAVYQAAADYGFVSAGAGE